MSTCQTQTDKVKKIELPSSIQQVVWTRRMASVGGSVGLKVFTHFVGTNSELKIELVDKSGKSFGTFTNKIAGNKFWAEVTVPPGAKEELYANAKLPKHGLSMKSSALIVLPPIRITNAKWDKKEARRGDLLKLTADVTGVPEGTEAMVEIWEYDQDKAHDFITKFPVFVKNKKVEAEWEYEYHEDTDDIPTHDELQPVGKKYNPPEYFFRVKIGGFRAESGLLEFRDWIEVVLTDVTGDKFAGERCVLHFADGSKKEMPFDENGRISESDIPPGSVEIELPNLHSSDAYYAPDNARRED
jgi:hypothetical protein